MSKSDITGLATGGHKWRTQKEALDEGVDLVVATPARLGQHIEAATLRLTQCQAVVLDEADVLLGDAYAFSQQVNTRVPKPGGVLSLSAEHASSQILQAFQVVYRALGWWICRPCESHCLLQVLMRLNLERCMLVWRCHVQRPRRMGA